MTNRIVRATGTILDLSPDSRLPSADVLETEVLIPAERRLPPIEHGRATPALVRQVHGFYDSVAEIFERWVTRRKNERTQRTYRNHGLRFIQWLGLRWPDEASELLRVTSEDVQAYRDSLIAEGAAPTTVDQRLSALSRFYEFVIRQAAKGRLPINVLNPAHPDFVSRENAEAKKPARALTLEQLHECLSLPDGSGLVALRDRALLNVGFAMGFRVSTLCRLGPTDFFEDQRNGPQVRYWQKGDRNEKPQGVNSKAFVAVRQYRDAAKITSGALFRPRANRSSEKLADRHMSERGMTDLLQSYLDRVPGGMEPTRTESGEEVLVSVFSPHSIRATTATILDGQEVTRAKIQKLLGHKKPETTDGYCQTEHAGRDSASHQMPL